MGGRWLWPKWRIAAVFGCRWGLLLLIVGPLAVVGVVDGCRIGVLWWLGCGGVVVWWLAVVDDLAMVSWRRIAAVWWCRWCGNCVVGLMMARTNGWPHCTSDVVGVMVAVCRWLLCVVVASGSCRWWLLRLRGLVRCLWYIRCRAILPCRCFICRV